MKTGTANLPLHGGSAPPWLFKRMSLLAGEIVEALIYEHGQEEFRNGHRYHRRARRYHWLSGRHSGLSSAFWTSGTGHARLQSCLSPGGTSWKDPARFSFAHGGKDGTSFPVDRATYDRIIQTLHEAVEEAKLDKKEMYNAIKRLEQYAS